MRLQQKDSMISVNSRFSNKKIKIQTKYLNKLKRHWKIATLWIKKH